MSSDRIGRQCIKDENGNLEKYDSILEDFFNPSLEHQFGDRGVIFMDDNA